MLILSRTRPIEYQGYLVEDVAPQHTPCLVDDQELSSEGATTKVQLETDDCSERRTIVEPDNLRSFVGATSTFIAVIA